MARWLGAHLMEPQNRSAVLISSAGHYLTINQTPHQSHCGLSALKPPGLVLCMTACGLVRQCLCSGAIFPMFGTYKTSVSPPPARPQIPPSLSIKVSTRIAHVSNPKKARNAISPCTEPGHSLAPYLALGHERRPNIPVGAGHRR
jgi:hypothetical protein